MSGLTENEILARYLQSLGEAHEASVELGRNADPERRVPRGRWYVRLRTAVEDLEGACRQMSFFRGDARWTRLAALYSRALLTIQRKFVASDWRAFAQLVPLFANGKREVEALQMKTGKIGPILPQRPSDWLILPGSGTMH